MTVSSVLMIEVDGQPTVTVTIEDVPDIVFQDEAVLDLVFSDTGIQGPPGPSALSGDGIKVVAEFINIDISSLTFAP